MVLQLTQRAEDVWSQALYDSLPLSSESFQTRFLRLHRGSGDAQPQCTLFTSTLIGTEYDALSYTWGTDRRNSTVTVNGISVGVTPNLHAALLALRHRSTSRVLWIDALCINQVNLKERTAQVKHMGQIYRCARKVIIWIGEESHSSGEAFEFIRQYLGTARTRQLLSTDMNYPRGGMADLLNRPYWMRVWIVQEIAQATSDPLIVCGKEVLPWSEIVDFASALDQFLGLQAALRRINILQGIRLRTQTPPRLRLMGDQSPEPSTVRQSYAEDLFYFLDQTLEFHATDPRDKIFALLGLTRGLSAQVTTADYGQSVQRVFIDLAETAISRSLSLDITSYKSPSTFSEAETLLPSWVPDFSSSSRRSIPLPAVEGIGGIQSPIPQLKFSSSSDGARVLHVDGIFAHTISVVEDMRLTAKRMEMTDYEEENSFDFDIGRVEWSRSDYRSLLEPRIQQWREYRAFNQEAQDLEASTMIRKSDLISDCDHMLAKTLFLLHVRLHQKNGLTCHRFQLATPCSSASLQSAIRADLDWTQVRDICTANAISRFEYASLTNRKGINLAKKFTSMKPVDMQRARWSWPEAEAESIDAVLQAISCEGTLRSLQGVKLADVGDDVFGCLVVNAAVEPGDQMVLFQNTLAPKIIRRVSSGHPEQLRYILIGDAFFYWPLAERYVKKLFEDGNWRQCSLV